MSDQLFKFKIGDYVEKTGGDYTFIGWIMMIGTKRSGAIRIAVENEQGLVHIFNPSQLKLALLPGQLFYER